MKLKHQLALTLVGLAASALVVTFILVYVFFRQDQTHALDAVILPRARAAAKVLPGSLRLLEPRMVAVYDSERRPIASTKAFGTSPPSWTELGVDKAIPDEGVSLDVMVRGRLHRGMIVPSRQQGKVLLYVAPRRLLDRTLSFLSRLFALLLGAALVITSVVAWWLGGRLSRNVATIASLSRRVAAGDRDARIPEFAGGSSEIRDLRGDLNTMIAALDDMVKSQQSFIAYAAHELRSPLTALRGELELALRRERTAEEYKRTLEKLYEEIRLLSTLAEDLLLLARIQGRTVTPSPVPVRDLVAESFRSARTFAELRGVSLEVEESEALGESVLAGGADAARALRNLLDNSIEHSRPGGVVRVTVASNSSQVAISVTDRGTGIAAPDVANLFTPFFRGAIDQAGSASGAGLGLTIASEIARSHGGSLRFDDTYREGARFVLELPAAVSPMTRV